MESSGECMNNNTALMTLRNGSRESSVIFGSYQVRSRWLELNMKWLGQTIGHCCGYSSTLIPMCFDGVYFPFLSERSVYGCEYACLVLATPPLGG